jgi:hypothetical protein
MLPFIGMTQNQVERRSWSDSDLASAVSASHSWRAVMRKLGLNATSAGAIRYIKRHVIPLELDTSHFTGQRRWTDAQLRRAAADAVSWDELIAALGLAPIAVTAVRWSRRMPRAWDLT